MEKRKFYYDINSKKIEVRPFYDDYEDYLECKILSAGDLVLLVSGGHGFTILEEIEMIEVKHA